MKNGQARGNMPPNFFNVALPSIFLGLVIAVLQAGHCLFFCSHISMHMEQNTWLLGHSTGPLT